MTALTPPHAPCPPPLRTDNSEAPAKKRLLVVRVGAAEYSIELARVREVRSQLEHPDDHSQDCSLAALLQHRATPLVDLRRRYSRDRAADAQTTLILLEGRRQEVVGVVVDAITGVIEVEVSRIHPLAPLPGNVAEARDALAVVVLGEGATQRRLTLLDAERLAGSGVSAGPLPC